MLRRIDNKIRTTHSIDIVGIGLLVLSLVFGISGYIRVHGHFDLMTFLNDYYANISTELGSIAITVVIIDHLARWRDKSDAQDEEKQKLVRQMRSNNRTALNAIEQLHINGWLRDGTLVNVDFSNTNLSGSNLSEADLKGADFTSANLSECDLSGSQLSAIFRETKLERANLNHADLSGANLSNANLKGVNLDNTKFDKRTILPDARLYHQRGMRMPYTKYWTPETDMRRYTDPEHPDFWQPDWVKEQVD